jgi:energy-coupling factor transporter ATP-binding protein EcfA2
VGETLEFAFQCKSGGRSVRERDGMTAEQLEAARRMDIDGMSRKVALTLLGLRDVEDTFVGDTNVRGVSGGQRRRVTVGEMSMTRVPVLCGDEISTGLDAASTYDMVETLLHLGRLQNFSRVFSLLQPSPEVVSLFDEVIVLAEGLVIYAGPIEQVEDYFANAGFTSPEFMDVADFLQMVSTEDRGTLFSPGETAPTVADLAEIFQESEQGLRIHNLIKAPNDLIFSPRGSVKQLKLEGVFQLEAIKKKYANKWYRSIQLISQRFLTLWIRDKKVLMFSIVRNVINGASVGGAFFNAGDFISIQGALFQTGIFILLGSLQSSSGLVEDRVLYHKQAKANFYSAWPYVFGQAISQLPQVRGDLCLFASSVVITDQFTLRFLATNENQASLRYPSVGGNPLLYDWISRQRKFLELRHLLHRSLCFCNADEPTNGTICFFWHQLTGSGLWRLYTFLRHSVQRFYHTTGYHSRLLFLDLLVEPVRMGVQCPNYKRGVLWKMA